MATSFATSLLAPYYWTPVQKGGEKWGSLAATNTPVHTLSLHLRDTKLQGAMANTVRLETTHWKAHPRGSTVWCYKVAGSCILCQGTIFGTVPRKHDPNGGPSMRIGRLPEGCRPDNPLQFAAVVREAYEVYGTLACSSQMITLVVTPDGWILGVGRDVEGFVDLSAIRFCTGKGISLQDEASLHPIDLAGSRIVMLQGSLAPRNWKRHSKQSLAILPENCRPPHEITYIVAGSSSGGFHLVRVRPAPFFNVGRGGDLMWSDGIWIRDRIHLTGVMFEVAPEAVQISEYNFKEGIPILIREFQNCLLQRWGTMQEAWTQAFDIDGSGMVNFTEFSMGCKRSGYVGSAMRIWTFLDENNDGDISLEEMERDLRPKTPTSALLDIQDQEDRGLTLPPIRGLLEAAAEANAGSPTRASGTGRKTIAVARRGDM